MNTRITQLSGLLLTGLFSLFLVGCGGGEDKAAAEETAAMETVFDLPEEIQDYFATKVNIPVAEFEAVERGDRSEEEIKAKKAAGEYPKFFQFASPEDIPDDLAWEDGMDLPEFSSPDAKKGGIRYQRLQDFPRTLRTVGPDANGGFRPYLLDDVVMQFARRHPNKTEIGPQGHYYYPGVAKEWAVDRENKRIFVRLNERARWSDGVPLRVKDVFYMFYMYQSPHIQAPWYNNWYNRQYTQVTRYDELTFSVSLPEAKPDMNARVLELSAKPAHFYGVLNEEFTSEFQWKFAPTTGAYVVREDGFQKGRFIRLERLKDWWAKDNRFWRNRFNFDAIQFSVIRDTPKAFESFLKGELDAFGMNLAEYNYERLPDDHPKVEKGYINKYTFYNDVPRPTYGLWINSHKPLLENRNIRVGIQYATNWDRVIKEYFRGDYERMRTTADGFGEFTHPDLQPRSYNVTRALEHFAKAGFTERGPDGFLVNGEGEKLSFNVTTGYEAFKDLLTILQEEAARAGLEFRLEILDGTAGWKKAQEKKHDITFSAFGVSPEMYPRYWETYHSVNAYKNDGSVKTQTNNLVMIDNPELDKRIEAYRASEDAGEMIDLAHEMEEILHHEAVFIPGFVMPFYRFASWRWLQWPEDLNAKLSQSPGELFLSWIEPGWREETMRAPNTGETFPKVIKVVDKYNTYSDGENSN